MNRHDGSCPGSDELGEKVLIEIQGIGAAVAKDRGSATENERINRGDEGEAGNDHLVPGANIEQLCGHFQRVRARSSQKRTTTEALIQQGLTLSGKLVVAGDPATFYSGSHRLELTSHHSGAIKRNRGP